MEVRPQSRVWIVASGTVILALGCGSSGGMKHEDSRRAAYVEYNEGQTAFAARDYPGAEAKFTSAIDRGMLNPDYYCFAITRRAVCWGAAGKGAEALADLDKLGNGAPNLDEIFAARAFILAKQGKAAEAKAALAKAKRFNPRVKGF